MKSITSNENWKKAAFLHERAIARNRSRRFEAPEQRAEAERRARVWQESMMSSEGIFEERLQRAGLDRDAFLQLLANAGTEASAWTDGGAWLETLEEVLERRHENESLPTTPPAQADSGTSTTVLFPGFLAPFLQTGAARLCAAAAAIGVRHGLEGALLGERAEAALLESLAWRLQGKAMGLLVLELHIAKLRGKLPQGTPQERFDHFATTYFEDPAALLELLQKAPVLARLLATTLDRWSEVNFELLERLAEDWTLIRDRFCTGTDLGGLAALRPGMGDLHRGGRSVVQLEFTSGLKLVYKPRSLAVEAKFQDVLAWLNAKGVTAQHRLLTVADRGSHGWVEFVQAAECEDKSAVERFYLRQGSHLALLHVLKGVDMHQENLIAAGEHPVVVDLEAIFHHDTPIPDDGTALSRALDFLNDSILYIGLLPAFLPQAGQQVDVSALGGGEGQLYAEPVRVIEDPLRDTMRVVRRRPRSEAAENRPRLGGEELDVGAFAGKLVEGFQETYRIIMRHRDEFAILLRGFAEVEIRHLLRSSMRYMTFLSETCHPDFLRDALERERSLDKLWAAAAAVGALRRVVPFEIADLRLGDIPLFTTRPGSRDLWSSTGERIEEFFERDSLSDVLRRLAHLSEDDCAAQSALLLKSLIGVDRSRHAATHIAPLPADAGSAEPAPAGAFLDAAVAIGEGLAAQAIHGRDDVIWIGETAVSFEPWRWTLAPLQLGLYEGLGGMALFFAHLGAATHRGDFEALARASLQPILCEIHRTEQPAPTNLGPFFGEASHVFVLSQLAAVWREPALLDSALEVLPGIEAHIATDESLDLIGGAAGCIITMLDLHRQTEDRRALDVARRCGDHLLAKATPVQGGAIAWKTRGIELPLAGFAHGVAGVAWALLELSAATGDERYRDAARRSLAYERSLFVPARGNWVDLRLGAEAPADPQTRMMAAWCHGATGIALGRVLSLRHLDDPLVRTEIKVGLETTLREGFGFNDSLCHGDLGNVDMLLVMSEALNEPRWRQAALRHASQVIAHAEGRSFRCGFHNDQDSPSLMVGLAGIGLGLLRVWSPETVPSVLCLQPAVPRRQLA